MEQEKLQLFDFTTNFCTAKADLRKHPDFLKVYNPFMINRVLSMSPKTCHLALFMSRFPDIPKEQHFIFFNTEMDKDRIFFKYAKPENDVPAKTIAYLQDYFECSFGRALEYAKLLSEKKLKTVLKVMETRDAKIKKRKAKAKKQKPSDDLESVGTGIW